MTFWTGPGLDGRRVVQVRAFGFTVIIRPHGRGIAGSHAAFLYHYPPRIQVIRQ